MTRVIGRLIALTLCPPHSSRPGAGRQPVPCARCCTRWTLAPGDASNGKALYLAHQLLGLSRL